MKNVTITIGIPAYNEALNIKHLIDALFRQKLNKAEIKQIIVISDASTDNTEALVRSIRDKRIIFKTNTKRLGKPETQNRILKLATGDVLVLLDADILPANNTFIQEIITPITNDFNVGLVGADVSPARPVEFFEKVIVASHEFKKDIFKQINNANNVYLCHGRARAFSKKFYSQMFWPNRSSEDAFSYFQCLNNNFKFKYAPRAKILFRSVSTFKDHEKQSSRFILRGANFTTYYPKSYIKSIYDIPKVILLKTFIKHVINQPLFISLYVLIAIWLRIIYSEEVIPSSVWSVAESSKKILTDKV